MSFEGSIGEIDLIQRLVELGREHFTGAIRFEQDGIIKIIYFKGGDVLSASTNDRKDAIDEILLRAGKVSREHVKQALAKRQESETLGDALLNLGFITRKELTWARRIQVIGILRSVRSWETGTYAIVADYLPKREEGTLFPLYQIIVEFIVTEQDRPSFDRAMDGGEAVFQKSATFDAAFPGLDLNDDAAEIVRHVDGQRSAAEIAGATGAEAFNVYKLLEALRTLGLLEKQGAAAATPAEIPMTDFSPALDATPAEDFSFESAGVADASDAFNAEPPPAEEPAPPAAPSMQFQMEEEPKIPFALTRDAESTASSLQPQWGQVPVENAPAAIPGSTETPVEEEKKWGFDEAQIETSERAIVPPNLTTMPPKKRPTLAKPAPKPRGGRSSLLFILIFLLLLGGVAAGGWMWWQARNAQPAPELVVKRPAKRPVITPPPVMPPVMDTTATTATTASVQPPPAVVPPPTSTVAATKPAPKPQPVAKTEKQTAPVVSRLEQTSTGKMITNTSASAPSSAPSKNAGKYDDMAHEFAKNPAGNFTVQFELVCQASSLQKAIAGGGASVWFVPTTYRGQSCYRVFWGHYDTRESAISAMGKIPEALRGSTPVVVSVPKS
jgi:cytoskeletal protein RodZ